MSQAHIPAPGPSKDLEILAQLLKRIYQLQDKHWRNGINLNGEHIDEQTNANFKLLVNRVCKPIGESELDTLITQSMERSQQLSISNLFLPPLSQDEDFVPVLSIKYDFTQVNPTMRLCVNMFSFCNLEKKTEKKPLVFGFRFEIDHAKSNHDYCHSQLTRTFIMEKNSPHVRRQEIASPISSLPAWVPESTPCLIVPACCPVSLLFCMLISFYGKVICGLITDLKIDGKYFKTLKPLNIL